MKRETYRERSMRIYNRARAYVRGTIQHDPYSPFERKDMELAWQRGYEAAMRDTRKVARKLTGESR